MAWPPVLVRYGEIGIKSRAVRIQFERKLQERIEEQLIRRGVEAEVMREQGRFVVHPSDVDGAIDALRHTFGVVSASPSIECPPTPEGVAAVALEAARAHLPQGGSFAMRCKRVGSHAFTSLDVAKATASRILDELEERAPRVDLDAPDFEMHAEVREGRGYFYTRNVRGPGGLPLGSQGKVGVVVDSPCAAHAAWLMGKRGSALIFFATDDAAAKALLEPLAPWVPDLRVNRIPQDSPDVLRNQLTHLKCHALVRAGRVEASLAHFEEDKQLDYPVFRPLVGYVGDRFRELARLAELPADARC